MRKFSFLLIIMIPFLYGCISTSKAKLVRESKIAVLPFTARGPGISQKDGYIAADKLTTLLFVKRNISVVDRSQVNYSLYKRNIENIYFLSKEDLVFLADTLNVSVVVLGIMENRLEFQELDANKNELTITLRFLNGQDGETLQILYDTKEISAPPMKMVDQMLEGLIAKL